MARTYNQSATNKDFHEGFDLMDSVLGQVYLLQVKTGSPELDDALYGLAHEGRPVEEVINVLQNFKNLSVYSDKIVAEKAKKLAVELRDEHNRGNVF